MKKRNVLMSDNNLTNSSSEDPDIIVSISGSHPAKGILSVVIAEALKKVKVSNLHHLNYDSETFEQMIKAVNEGNESNLSSAHVLIVEYEEDEIDKMYQKEEEITENE